MNSPDRPVVVVALGGNALLPEAGPQSMTVQRERAAVAAQSIAPLSATHRVVVTHGNGPQVGALAERLLDDDSELSGERLDDLDAETEGMLGYLLTQALNNAVVEDVAALLTQVVVDPDDPAFSRPTKPIGPPIDPDRVGALQTERGWTIESRHGQFRRLVASPEPLDIVELSAIRALISAGIVTICLGGGGIPVARQDYVLTGVEGVVDKDLASALLAVRLDAQRLVLLTDIDAVWDEWETPRARPIVSAGADWFRTNRYEAGSMGPKVEAACRFAETTGREANIGALRDAAAVVIGAAGTTVVPEFRRPVFVR